MCVCKREVLFRNGKLCHWQNSVVASPTSRRRCRLTIHFVLHNQLVAGFSITAGIKRKQQSKRTCAEKRPSTLPTRTAAWSAGRRLGSPCGCFALRSAGGPPGRFLAFVIESQGVPIQTAATRPAFIQPKIKYRFSRFRRSYESPIKISHFKVGMCCCMALVNRPVPAKSSTTTATVSERPGPTLNHRARRRHSSLIAAWTEAGAPLAAREARRDTLWPLSFSGVWALSRRGRWRRTCRLGVGSSNSESARMTSPQAETSVGNAHL